jgi:hypothetical protein
VIAYFILGLALLLGSVLLIRWYVSSDPKQVARVARWTLAGVGIGLGLYLLFAGRQALAALALPALIPLILRYRGLWRRLKSAAGPTPGQTSEVTTRFFHMVLDHDSGAMHGEVLEGHFKGHRLLDLQLHDLLALRAECEGADAQSLAILETYLDRAHGGAWREAAASGERTGGAAPMTREEAYEILGLDPGADEAQIREAHRRLMQKIHPDHGGSNYLAAKINQAKDLLLAG